MEAQEKGFAQENSNNYYFLTQTKQISDLNTLAQDGVELDKNPLTLKEFIDKALCEKFTMADFLRIQEAIHSQDRFQQHYGIIGLRKILSVDVPPVQSVIDANLIPKLIEFMQFESEPRLQCESAWALANVAVGTTHQIQSIIDEGGIPLFVKLFSSPHTEVAEQSIWALGNIAGDSTASRDMILEAGGLDALIKFLASTTSKLNMKHGTWALSNLCRGKPSPQFDLVKNAIDPLAQVIKEEDDVEMLTDAAWTLSDLSGIKSLINSLRKATFSNLDKPEWAIELVTRTNIVPALVKHLSHPFLSILIPCLKILGNILTGNAEQRDLLIRHPGISGIIYETLKHTKQSVRKELCCVLSKIVQGTPQQIEIFISHPGFIKKLCQLALTDCPDVRREAVLVLSNIATHGNPEQVRYLADNEVIGIMKKQLDSEDDLHLVSTALESLYKIMVNSDPQIINPLLKHFVSFKEAKKIEKLKSREFRGAIISIFKPFKK